jgi:hypothetical protein
MTPKISGMKPQSQRQLSTGRGAVHRSAFSGERDAKPRPYPLTDIFDKELLVRRKSFRVKDR